MRLAILLTASLLSPGAALAQSAPPALAAGQLFDPITGYRISQYRGVVGAPPEGVARIDVAQAWALWREGAIFLDVNPAPGAIRDPETGRWTLNEPHESIPGALWFAESGRGRPTADIELWFVKRVRRLAAMHSRVPIVIFCQADCWMSWNASLRLHRAGLRDVRWFANGLDGWKEAGFRVKRTSPE